MTDDYDYEAEVQTDSGTVTFRGDNPRTVSAQAARMPAILERERRIRGMDMTREEWAHAMEDAHDD